ncbi:MAG: ComEC family competence protein [Alphaproteobacteria bacterium]|nr:ComEC family competence protein [Alphaproteobacteria bacterium]
MNKFLFSQYPNLILWAPFVIAFGALSYFAWPFEPVVAMPYIIAALCAACVVFAIRRFKQDQTHITYHLSLITLLLFGFGFFYATAFSQNLATPTVKRVLREIEITGRVENISYTAERTRIFVNLGASVDRSIPDNTIIRLSLKPEENIPRAGDYIKTTATLFKPEPANAPGSFDMAKFAYFKGFGATGFPHKEIEIVGAGAENNFRLKVIQLRTAIHDKIAAHNNIGATRLVDSLMLGHSGAIARDDYISAKTAGIGHIFSISGFHMTLIGGWFFVFFYFLFRCVPWLAARIPVRMPALMCSWICLLFYLQISGALVPSQRSFAMATIAMVAILFSRNLISLRNVCLTMGLLILINPNYVTDIGFHLSFSAIFGLVWLFGGRKFTGTRTRLQKIWRAVRDMFWATIIATIFTGPFIAYHFNDAQIYSIIGNMLCVPMFSILVMPLVLIGTVTGVLFGFYLPLDWAEIAFNFIISITDWVSTLPYAMLAVPRIPGISVVLFVIAALILMFVITKTKKEKLIKNIVIAIILFLITFSLLISKRPIFYSGQTGELVAFMTDSGRLQFNKSSSSNERMAFDSWDRLNGDINTEPRRPIGKGFAGEKYSVSCEDKVCTFTTPKWKLVYIQQFVPLYKNIGAICNSDTDFLVSFFRVNAPDCKVKMPRGPFVIYKSGRVEYSQTNRAWHQ